MSKRRGLAMLGLAAAVGMCLVVQPYTFGDVTGLQTGCDACHHAMMICRQANLDWVHPEGGREWATYPPTSHLITSWLLPAFDGSPYEAMQFASIVLIGCCLLAQYNMFAQILQPAGALSALFAWQWLCFECKFSNQNHIYANYFYSQLFGVAFGWTALWLTTCDPRRRGARWKQTLAVGLACLAYLCHIVPGIAFLGALGLMYLADACRQRSLRGGSQLVLLCVLGFSTIFGTGQLDHMRHAKSGDGVLEMRNSWLLMSSGLVYAVVIGIYFKRLMSRDPLGPSERVMTALSSLLITTGTLQILLAIQWLDGSTAAYSVKKMFFFTFPASAALVILVIAKRLLAKCSQWSLSRRLVIPVMSAALVLCVVQNFKEVVMFSMRGPHLQPDWHPHVVARRIAEAAQEYAFDHSYAYHDPAMRQAGVFVNTLALGHSMATAYAITDALRAGNMSGSTDLEQAGIHRVLAPSRDRSSIAVRYEWPGRNEIGLREPTATK